MLDKGDGGGDNSVNCKKYPQYCNAGNPKSLEELLAMRNHKPKRRTLSDVTPELLPDLFTGDLVPSTLLPSWKDDVDIESDDWEKLLSKISADAYQKNQKYPDWLLKVIALNYDTPFYDRLGYLSGIGCVDNVCYDRSELNYIGEGIIWAAIGVDIDEGHDVVRAWKNKGPFVLGLLGLDSTPREVSQGTLTMFDAGYYYYLQHYPPKP